MPDVLTNQPPLTQTEQWAPPAPPTDLVFDDGEPLESNRHRVAMNVLIRSLQFAWSRGTEESSQRDFFCGGNMFIYYSSQQVRNQDFRGPDFFVVLGVDPDLSRQGWVVWEEGGRYPDMIVELLSPSTAHVDRGPKKRLYEQVFRTKDYFVYDPFNPSAFEGWSLDEHLHYQPLQPNQSGWLWSESLGLWLGAWDGAVEREQTTWLRLFGPDGSLILLPEEAAQAQAQQAYQRAEQEHQRAEQASQRAEQEHQRAEQASQRAEQERQRAEQASQRAEQERQRAARLAEQLRSLGVNPEQP